MQAASRGHGQATQNGGCLRGGESLPLRQEQNLAIERPEPPKYLEDQRLLTV